MYLEGRTQSLWMLVDIDIITRVFMKKFMYQISVNRERMTTTQGAQTSLEGILSILLFLSWWRALKRRSNPPKIVWIPLEARHLNSFKKSCKYVLSYILNDKIICSQCLNVLNIRCNVFHCTWYFDQILEGLSISEPNRLRLLLWRAITFTI